MMTEEEKRHRAQEWARLCNECENDGCCPAMGFISCPFRDKKCGDIKPEDWINWLESKE